MFFFVVVANFSFPNPMFWLLKLPTPTTTSRPIFFSCHAIKVMKYWNCKKTKAAKSIVENYTLSHKCKKTKHIDTRLLFFYIMGKCFFFYTLCRKIWLKSLVLWKNFYLERLIWAFFHPFHSYKFKFFHSKFAVNKIVIPTCKSDEKFSFDFWCFLHEKCSALADRVRHLSFRALWNQKKNMKGRISSVCWKLKHILGFELFKS